ncbi:hypothetical protein CRG98_047934, partial [Punica granatum]
VSIDHGESSAAPGVISRTLSCRRRGVHGREPLPVASSPLIRAFDCRWLTGLDPFPLFRSSSPSPFSAQRLVRPSVSPGQFLLRAGQSDPIRFDPTRLFGDFFYLTEKPFNFPD